MGTNGDGARRRPNWAGGGRAVAVYVLVLLIVHVVVAWAAVRGKSATADEPIHVAAALAQVRYFDFRVDREDPPLWKYWAGLPFLVWPVTIDTASPDWASLPESPGVMFRWARDLFYRTPGNDADAILARSRAMMLVVAVAMGALVSWWAWRLGGRVAALVAAALFALDPNLLAHGPLVKNDVAFALGWLAVAYLLWRLGRRLSARGVLSAAGAFGLLAIVKFSAALALPMAAAVLAARAAVPVRWDLEHLRRPEGPARRVGLGAGVIVTFCLAGFLFTWAGYGFRYFLSPKYHAPLNWRELMYRASAIEAAKDAPAGEAPTPERVLATDPGVFATAVRDAEKLRLVPEAWGNGLLFTYVSVSVRRGYLLGAFSETGWWYYFPIALLVKTPLATLAAAAGAAGVLALAASGDLRRRRRGGRDAEEAADGPGRRARWMVAWSAACLALPPAVYLGFAMAGNLNLGIRHVLPVYPFAFVAAGWAASVAARRWGRPARVAVAVLLVGLAAETARAFPNYIPFFNAAVGADPRTRLHLLGDSNVDWGQDLPALKRWRDAHPDATLYLAYFGFADPAHHGVTAYVPLPGSSLVADPVPLAAAAGPGYVAASVTALQGLSIPPGQPNPYAALRAREPDWVIGGSIYVYRVEGRAPAAQ